MTLVYNTQSGFARHTMKNTYQPGFLTKKKMQIRYRISGMVRHGSKTLGVQINGGSLILIPGIRKGQRLSKV